MDNVKGGLNLKKALRLAVIMATAGTSIVTPSVYATGLLGTGQAAPVSEENWFNDSGHLLTAVLGVGGLTGILLALLHHGSDSHASTNGQNNKAGALIISSQSNHNLLASTDADGNTTSASGKIVVRNTGNEAATFELNDIPGLVVDQDTHNSTCLAGPVDPQNSCSYNVSYAGSTDKIPDKTAKLEVVAKETGASDAIPITLKTVKPNELYKKYVVGTDATGLTSSNIIDVQIVHKNGVDLLFAVAGTGGILRSDDNGRNWTPMNNGLGLEIGVAKKAVALIPMGSELYTITIPVSSTTASSNVLKDSRKMLIEGRIGVYKSTDAGSTWVGVESMIPSSLVAAIVDAGSSISSLANDYVYFKAMGDAFYVASPVGLYKCTKDAGKDQLIWDAVDVLGDAKLIAKCNILSVDVHENKLYVALQGTAKDGTKKTIKTMLYTSTDGNSWTELAGPDGDAIYKELNGSSSTAIVATDDAVYVGAITGDAGTSYLSLYSYDIAGSGANSQWSNISKTKYAGSLSLSTMKLINGKLYLGTSAGIWQIDPKKTDDKLTNIGGVYQNQNVTAISADESYIYMAPGVGGVVKAKTGANTFDWLLCNNGIYSSLQSIYQDPTANSTKQYAIFDGIDISGAFLESDDDGANWQLVTVTPAPAPVLPSGVTFAVNAVCVFNKVLYAATNNGIYVRDDQGAWKKTGTDTAVVNYNVLYTPDNTTYLYAAGTSTSGQPKQVFGRFNTKRAWQPITIDGDVFVNMKALNSYKRPLDTSDTSETFYAGTADSGLFSGTIQSSSNGDPKITWKAITLSTGVSLGTVNSLQKTVVDRKDALLYVAVGAVGAAGDVYSYDVTTAATSPTTKAVTTGLNALIKDRAANAVADANNGSVYAGVNKISDSDNALYCYYKKADDTAQWLPVSFKGGSVTSIAAKTSGNYSYAYVLDSNSDIYTGFIVPSQLNS